MKSRLDTVVDWLWQAAMRWPVPEDVIALSGPFGEPLVGCYTLAQLAMDPAADRARDDREATR